MSSPSPKSDSGSKSKQGKKNQRRPRELNVRAAIILGTLVLVGIPGFFFARAYQVQNERSALLAEAKKLLDRKPPEPNMALPYLTHYLELNPNDIDALNLKSKVLFDLVRSQEQANGAIKAHDQVVRRDNPPKPSGGAKRHLRYPEARRRVVQLNLLTRRFQTAYLIALELADSDTATAEDYRLLGYTLIALANDGSETVDTPQGKGRDTWAEAIKSFEEANRLDPTNVDGARNLASLYRAHGKDPKKAEQVLDLLLKNSKTAADKAAARLVRYEYYAASPDADANADKQAHAELEEAVRLQPDNPDVLLQSAVDSLRRGETEMARQRIAKVSSDTRKDMQLIVRGEVDAAENKMDAAIADWREGLKVTGGTSETLTWQLAYVLLRLGRTSEAEPLIKQYHRLTDQRSAGATPKGVFLDALMDLRLNRPKEAIEKLQEIRLKTASNTPGAAKTGVGTDQSLEAQVLFTLGQGYEAYSQEKQNMQALEAYRKAAKVVRSTRGLKWPDPWIGAARVLLRQGRRDEAASELEDGLAAIPGDSNLLINLARIRMLQVAQKPKDLQSWTGVEELLGKAQQVAPTSVDLVKLQVAFLTTVGRLDDAASLLTIATDPKYHPQNPDLWAMQAEVLRRLNQPEQALEALDRGTAAIGEQAILRVSRAQILLKRGQEKAAFATLTDGMTRVPPDQRPLLLQAQAELHRRNENPVGASKAYAEWAKIEPKDPRPLLAILELALNRDDVPGVKATMAALQKIGGLSAELADAMVLLSGRLETAQDEKSKTAQLNRADRVIKDIVERYPGNPIGYMLQGEVYERRGRVDDAVVAYQRARDNGGGPESLRRLFTLLASNRRSDDLKRLKSELHTGELTIDLEQTEATIALTLGDKDQAMAVLKQIARENQGIDLRIWQSQFFNRLGKPKEAEALLQDLIKQKPEALEPRLGLMAFQLGQQQYQKAAETVEQIRTQVKTERPEFVWAGCYATIGNTAKATEYYKAALQNWPNDQDVRARAVAFFRASGHPEEGEAALRDILKKEPKHAWATRELAQLLSAHINPTTGLADQNAWNEALQLIGDKPSESDTADDRLVRATVLARAPEPARRAEAIPMLEALISDSPGAVATMAHDLLARIYADAEQPAKALEQAKAAAVRNNDPATIAFYIELLLRDKKLEEAMKQVDRLARVESESLRVISLRARILQAEGKTPEAASLLEERFAALEKDNAPDEEVQGRKIIEMLIALKQFDAAERVGIRLAERRPRSAWAVAPLLARRGKLADALKYCKIASDNGAAYEAATAATLLVSTQSPGPDTSARLKEADVILEKALKQQPNNFGLLFNRASVKRLQGRYDEAGQIYSDLLTRNPDNPALLNNMAWTLSEDLNKPAEGLEKINVALQQKGASSPRRDPSWLDTRGVILTRLGKFNEAIEDLEASAKASPSPNVYYHLARAYQMAGRTAEFQKYRDLAQQSGLTPNLLQPSERTEMSKVMAK